MKKAFMIAIAALAFVAGGCSSDDDATPQGIAEGTDARPTWQAPNYDLYEQIMSVEVLLQDTLQRYASTNDLMCATIGSDVCGVATARQVDDRWVFPLIVGSSDVGAQVRLSFYCDRLHRIFTTDWMTFDANTPPTGEGGIYVPVFVK